MGIKMSNRTQEKIELIQADAISWIMQEVNSYLIQLADTNETWNQNEVMGLLKWSKDVTSHIRNEPFPYIEKE